MVISLNKNIIPLSVLIILFLIGIMLILKSSTWYLGSYESMHLAGTIISIFSGSGLLIKFYIDQKKS